MYLSCLSHYIAYLVYIPHGSPVKEGKGKSALLTKSKKGPRQKASTILELVALDIFIPASVGTQGRFSG